MKMRKLYIIVLKVFLIIVFSQLKAISDEKIKIGLIVPLSGHVLLVSWGLNLSASIVQSASDLHSSSQSPLDIVPAKIDFNCFFWSRSSTSENKWRI